MPDIKKYLEGKFARAGISLRQGVTIRFINAGRLVDNPFEEDSRGPEKRLIIGIEVGGEKKLVAPNATSMRELSEAYGTDTNSWVNKTARVTLQDKVVYGQKKKIAFFHPILGVACK